MMSTPSPLLVSCLSHCIIASLALAAGPCDIYASGGTPCVAAHSTTRALFSAYFGPLYQISRGSDNATIDISPLSAGGVANASAQDSFCSNSNTTCLIATIYDQTGRGNHLKQAPPGGADKGTDPNGFDTLAAADGAPVTLNSQKAYGVFISPGTGYRNDVTNGIAVGDDPEGMYAIFDGTHVNGDCCFDYGNAETSNTDTGNGAMEAIYFGTGGGKGSGSGPWVQMDAENGLFSGGNRSVNPSNPTSDSRFVTAIVKGQPNNWAIRGGDATSGSLSTFFNGVRPSGGYNPMKKQGAIILGIGGDNSNRAQGTFYEGVMTSGFPSDETENSVQANIGAAGYAAAPMTSGPSTLSVGSAVSFRATTACCTNRYIAHTGTMVNTQIITPSNSSATRLSASWNVVAGLGNNACVSFESRDTPGNYIRHSNFQLFVNVSDGTQVFKEDATWCPQAALNGKGNSIRSWSFPTHYFRHFNAILYAASNGGPSDYDSKNLFNDDVSWVVGPAFA
ncbi:Arabinosidase B [Roridomyces roridus]|uniref:Alpha-L-arabinofuranosidase n=1 Tax=Roridomyces roridus TaxID=1738132 RepID=A0AAD7BZR2_9AGAR|nr:Arabinosidase B [Roridomyces roridus]